MSADDGFTVVANTHNDTIVGRLGEDGTIGLNSISSVVSSDGQRSVGDIELVDERNKGRLGSVDQSTN